MKFDMKVTAHIDTGRPDKILRASYKTVDWGARRIMKRARQLVPVDTGALKRSIEIKDIAGGKAIGPDTNYDAYVEFGTATRFIEPVKASVLHWVVNGKHYFSKGHWLPGTRKQPYMRPALDENKKRIMDHLAGLVRKALR